MRAAAESARTDLAEGILSPTTVLLEGTDLDLPARGAGAGCGAELTRQPGVAGVLGPGSQPLPIEANVLINAAGAGGTLPGDP